MFLGISSKFITEVHKVCYFIGITFATNKGVYFQKEDVIKFILLPPPLPNKDKVMISIIVIITITIIIR